MKKILLFVIMVVMTFTIDAQLLRNDFLKGYKLGDKLEKGVYTGNRDKPRFNTWYGAYNPEIDPSIEGPYVGDSLVYEGYKERGPSIDMDGEGQMNRVSVYSLTKDDKEFAEGTFYLAFLVNFKGLGSSKFYDFVGFDVNPLSRASRGRVLVAREGRDKIKFGVAVRSEYTAGTNTYDYDKTQLLVLKIDYDRQQVSLYVNPDLNKGELRTELIANAKEGELENGLKSIYYRYRKNYLGNMGNFRFSTNWNAAIGR